MFTPSLFHWSKDFVEHLRAVHFALALVSIILIIADTSGLDGRLKIALTQIQEIAKFEKQWPNVSRKIYEKAMEDKHLLPGWSNSLSFVIPARYYAKHQIDARIDTPLEKIVKPNDSFISGMNFPASLSTLSGFKEFWGQMHEGVVLRLPLPPTGESYCDQYIWVTYIE